MDGQRVQRFLIFYYFLKSSFVCQVLRILEGTETALFKQFFSHWNETDNPSLGFGRTFAPGSVADWNIEDLHFEARKRIAKSAGSAIGYSDKLIRSHVLLNLNPKVYA